MNKWEAGARVLMHLSGATVRRYRKANTGTAYIQADDWGIECPRPRGPISFAILAHEVGHQMLHRHGKRPRWVEEVEAWEYALDCVRDLEPSDSAMMRVEKRAVKSIAYAFVKARRRGVTQETIRERFPFWWHEVGGYDPRRDPPDAGP